MGIEYNTSDTASFTITWLSQTGEEATVTGTPTITIKRYNPSTDDWTTLVSAQNMTVETGSTWYYEQSLSGYTTESDYKVFYNAVVETLNVESTEMFRVVTLKATQADIRELRFGNQRIDFTIATAADSGRNVVIGYPNYQTIYTKADSDSDWSSPTSTKVLYFWYDSSGNLISVKEND